MKEFFFKIDEFEKSKKRYSRFSNFWLVYKLLDPDPEEPTIDGSDWIRIRNTKKTLQLFQRFISLLGKIFSGLISRMVKKPVTGGT